MVSFSSLRMGLVGPPIVLGRGLHVKLEDGPTCDVPSPKVHDGPQPPKRELCKGEALKVLDCCRVLLEYLPNFI